MRRRWELALAVAVALIGARLVPLYGQDLTTQLTLFLVDLRSGALGATQTFASVGLASGGAGTAKDTTLTATAAGTITQTGTSPFWKFGGTTSSFPMLKQVGANLQIRLADDSAAAALRVSGVYANTFNTSASSLLLFSDTAPTISSGFGGTPSIAANNGNASFTVNVGTGGAASSGVIGLATATTAWNCWVQNTTALAANRANERTVMTSSTTNTATVQNQLVSTGVAQAWAASDILMVSCIGR